MSRHISQREAHRLRKRVKTLERAALRLTCNWTSDTVGTWLATEENVSVNTIASILTAYKLKRGITARVNGANTLDFFALEVPK